MNDTVPGWNELVESLRTLPGRMLAKLYLGNVVPALSGR